MVDDKQFDIFVASSIGSFKHVKYHTDQTKNNKKCLENLVDVKCLQKDDSITTMTWGNKDQTEILLARKNRQIQCYNTQSANVTKVYTADFGDGDVVGLGIHERKLIAGVRSGVVKVWKKKEEITVSVGGKIDRMKVCSDDTTLFGTGGEENDLKVWRIGESTPIFTAKNPPHDWLQLRRPIWVSDLTFLPDQGGHLLAVCSRFGYTRLYDTRAQRRPVCTVEFPNGMAATCIESSFDSRQVLVGFGRGQLHQVDLRKGKPDKGYKGCVGCVTDIAVHRPLRLVVSTSLDRHLRVHSYDTKELLYKIYLTSKPTSVLVQTETSTPLQNPPEVQEKQEKDVIKVNEDDDMDDLFNEMEPIREKRRKKDISEKSEIEVPDSIATEDVEEVKPSTEGTTDFAIEDSVEDKEAKIMQLLKSTERQKRRLEKRKKEKKARSVFHNA
ncbi:WD repeat-containing protein 74-like [Battus philenor]|uniref:WD repeat-containing protein 74-like n=1 Tax=Battus philenor TaxID=42288 RepID=UPI0035CF7667